jgi:hypothetical protein
MSVNRHIDKMFVLVLVAVTVVVAAVLLTQLGGHSAAAGAGDRPAASIAHSRGEPGIPPILPVARSELAAGRLAETQKPSALVNHVAANARYSTAVFNGYATTRK